MAWSDQRRHLMRAGLGHPAEFLQRLLRRTPRLAKRRFIPPILGVQGFFRELRDRHVRYAVLRWFETLPDVAPGEDIDMLIDDADLAAVADLFHPTDGLPCDVYSVTGRPGTDHHGVPYLPPAAAIGLLDRAILLGGLFRVPSPADHFLSLAFHAVYHKGLKSGLRMTAADLEPTGTPEHDYTGELARLASALGIDIPITLEALHHYLVARGWAPTDAMLNMLVRRNAWLAAVAPGQAARPPGEGLMPAPAPGRPSSGLLR